MHASYEDLLQTLFKKSKLYTGKHRKQSDQIIPHNNTPACNIHRVHCHTQKNRSNIGQLDYMYQHPSTHCPQSIAGLATSQGSNSQATSGKCNGGSLKPSASCRYIHLYRVMDPVIASIATNSKQTISKCCYPSTGPGDPHGCNQGPFSFPGVIGLHTGKSCASACHSASHIQASCRQHQSALSPYVK